MAGAEIQVTQPAAETLVEVSGIEAWQFKCKVREGFFLSVHFAPQGEFLDASEGFGTRFNGEQAETEFSLKSKTIDPDKS